LEGRAGWVGNPPRTCPAAAYVLADGGALDGKENERGGAHAHDDGGRGYDENVMRMSGSNGLHSCGGALGPHRWNDALGGGMVRLLGGRLPAYRHAQFEEILPDLTGYLETENKNTLGQVSL